MIIDPYKLRPVAPRVALLLEDGSAVDETGELLDLDRWPQGVRLWASFETVYRLIRDGQGEALCWRNEEIRWRHRRFEDDWKPRASDANVIRLPFNHLEPEKQLEGFRLWRDWLASYGAAPTGTSGSAAWSLLRARLEHRLFTNSGERPPILFTVGGRQELGPNGQGRYDGPLAHLDLPAAYASTLAGLRYGGVWLEHDPGVAGRDYRRFAGGDYPVFVRAQVKLPDLWPGPLVKRPRRAPASFLESVLTSGWYPSSGRLQGVWTFEELQAAERLGARILKILEAWTHRSGWFPFAPWWDAIETGRALGGLAGNLAKTTGNALWGRFCMDVDHGGSRSIRSSSSHGKLSSRPLRLGGQMFPAHDLAETVSGRVRARLSVVMAELGSQLVCAHTDGVWALTASQEVEGWRHKEDARRLDLLDPQVLRYWPAKPNPREPFHVYAGIPAELAPVLFQGKWEAAGYS